MSDKQSKNHNTASQAESSKPHIHIEDAEAEVMDNVAEAAEGDSQAEEAEAAELDQIESLAKQLGLEKAKLEKEKKEYLFLMAEFDNFRKRTLKEKSEIIRNAGENVLKGLLPIVDDFERGLQAANADSESATAIKEGMEIIYNKFVKYLEQNGVKAIESTGVEFDPEIHEAIAMVPAQSNDQKGKIIDTPTKGYTLNGDKVLRHAKVVVAQ